MARRSNLRKSAGKTITLQISFYKNGALFNPYSITSVKVYGVASGGTALATLSAPTQTSTGVYQTSWSIPTTQAAGVYYDEWIWQADQASLTTKTQRYSFEVTRATTGAAVSDNKPLFVGAREITFFNGINKELLQRVVGQKIIYYSVSLEHTNVHRLYDEAIEKTVYTPVEINALVFYKEPEQNVNQFSIDTIYGTEVYFYQEELRERKIIPREGDFLRFGDVDYEIEKLTRPQITFGQIAKEVMVKAVCRVARESQFNVPDGLVGA